NPDRAGRGELLEAAEGPQLGIVQVEEPESVQATEATEVLQSDEDHPDAVAVNELGHPALFEGAGIVDVKFSESGQALEAEDSKRLALDHLQGRRALEGVEMCLFEERVPLELDALCLPQAIERNALERGVERAIVRPTLVLGALRA